MPRPSIEYMNARRELKAASGGAKQDHSAKYAPDDHTDGIEIARNAIGAFSLWAETTRQVLVSRLGIPQQEACDEIPF